MVPNLRTLIPIKRFREPAPVVAVLRLHGVIGVRMGFRQALTLAGLEPLIERAFKMKHLKAVALAVNSPGGSPVQSSLIAGRIRALADEKKVPVMAFAEDVAASGGYWLACAADEIFADAGSIVGSIGVISTGFGFHDLLERIGVERRLHTAGTRKSLLDPFLPQKEEDVIRLTAIQKDIHGIFQEAVRTSRKDRLKAGEEMLFNGEFWTGSRALELGLVDGIGDMRSVLRQRHGPRVRLCLVTGGRPWWRLAPRLSMGGSISMDWSVAMGALEERALWSRFGL